MTNQTYVLSGMVSEAIRTGTVIEPTGLLQALHRYEDAVKTLFNHDHTQELFAAFNSEFGYFPRCPPGSPSPDATVLRRWAGLVSWLMSAIDTWGPSTDPQSYTFVAILLVSQALDAEGILWEVMPASCSPPKALIDRFKAIVRSFSISFAAVGGASEPTWEREAVDKFAIDDAQGNWAEIGNGIRLFERSLYFVSLALTQPVRCLYRCALDQLVDAVAGLRQSLIAIQIASVLSDDKRLRLAAASANPYIEFGCVFQTLVKRHPVAQLNPENQRLLSDILLKVADDKPRWASWMRVFNTYPNRYPALQAPLGVALASAPEHALVAFVEALQLTAQPVRQDLGRSEVANCLRAFRAAANPNRRASLWKLAHDKWSAWDFDKDNAHTHLLEINRSQLDYAIVGFACEVMTAEERNAAIATLSADLNKLDLQWFASHTDINDAWNRLLSRFQPYAFAAQIAQADADWLAQEHLALPFDPSTNAYAKMKYHLANLSPSVNPSSLS